MRLTLSSDAVAKASNAEPLCETTLLMAVDVAMLAAEKQY